MCVCVAGAPADSASAKVASRLSVKMRPESTPADASTTSVDADVSAAESAMDEYLISVVNAQEDGSWTAGVNEYFEGKSKQFLKQSCGLKLDAQQMAIAANLEPIPYDPANPTAQQLYPPTVIPGTTIEPQPVPSPSPSPSPSNQPLPTPPETVAALPLEFDARRQWGAQCRSVYDIRDQAGCGSCWAVATAEVATDRTCIGSAGARQPYLSAKNILTCCGADCGSCEGGYPMKAFEMWSTRGVVTGGSFGTEDSCQPYFLAPCHHHGDGGVLPKCMPYTSTPSCSESCTHGQSYQGDKSFAAPGQAGAYQLPSNEETIMRDLMTNGPIVAGFMVYADFPMYKSGVYRHVQGEMVGGHAIKILGWGVENGHKYWLAANSWNRNWGQDGFFKIARGINEGGIESMMWSGLAKNV
jgi:cathepsin B